MYAYRYAITPELDTMSFRDFERLTTHELHFRNASPRMEVDETAPLLLSLQYGAAAVTQERSKIGGQIAETNDQSILADNIQQWRSTSHSRLPVSGAHNTLCFEDINVELPETPPFLSWARCNSANSANSSSKRILQVYLGSCCNDIRTHHCYHNILLQGVSGRTESGQVLAIIGNSPLRHHDIIWHNSLR